MLISEAKAACRALGIVANVADGEWRISKPLAFFTDHGMSRRAASERAEATACYTYCPEDAVATARHFAAQTPAYFF